MSNFPTHSPAYLLQRIDKRVFIAVIGFVVAAIIGATSLVGAQADNKADKPTKEWCASHGYTNYGQCVSEWAKGHGYGYGG